VGGRTAHFRAHERRALRLAIELVVERTGVRQPALVVDLSLAGAGLETEEPLTPGERLSLTLATPAMWDPLVVEAVVAWSMAPHDVDPLGRSRAFARAGVAFAYAAPKGTLAMFQLLTTLGFE
jgi:hypothetical protein